MNRIQMGSLKIQSFLIREFHFLFLLFLLFLPVTSAGDRIVQGEYIRDGETLQSSGGVFELGFFSPGSSSLRFVGIWYANISEKGVIWVANRNVPVLDRKGSFTVAKDGNFVVLDGSGEAIWSSNASLTSQNTSLILSDDGNLGLLPGPPPPGQPGQPGPRGPPGFGPVCWQSFDHPTDTYLPGMRVLVSGKTVETRVFVSWKNGKDPSNGRFSMGVDSRAAPQIVIWEGMNRKWRSGHWNGLIFSGVPSMAAFYSYGFKLSNRNRNGDMLFTYTPSNSSNLFRFTLTWDGFEKSLSLVEGGKKWDVLQSEPSNDCDVYNKCGNNGFCNMDNYPKCECFHGFEPKFRDQWKEGNWSGGCVRKTQLECKGNTSRWTGKQDGFLKIEGLKLPDFAVLLGAQENQCENACSKNCSCKAFAYVTGIGCMTWSADLVDIQQFSTGGNALFVRLASSDLVTGKTLSGPKIAAIVVSGALFFCILSVLYWRFRAQLKGLVVPVRSRENNEELMLRMNRSRGYSTDLSGPDEGNFVNAPDIPLFHYDMMASATNFFAEENKLGQGGFGTVYKGKLPRGQEIAVKALSRKSSQGMEEFKNEIQLIAKLQHRNLVRILGGCIHGEEKMLLYEYMPNKSLDSWLFDPTRQSQLDWKRRFTIVEGIARGLVYLHRDCRYRIIHRDLKASNILLDDEMNAKISDFGIARIFGGNQNQANTNRVVGTYGYMSPEYAMEGLFSEKSDVYSFGILLLEIVSGRRNSSFRCSEYMSLIVYAWQYWNEGKALEIIDRSMGESFPSHEVLKCIHIALLCVQDSAASRPTMASVVLWLESSGVVLPIPREPTMTYLSTRGSIDIDVRDSDSATLNDVTVTTIAGR